MTVDPDLLAQCLDYVKAAGYKVTKPKQTVERPTLNALGKPFSPQYDPNYKMRHRVTPISRLNKPGWVDINPWA